MATHVIFDLGGTIINTPDVFRDVLQQFVESKGKQLTQEIKALIPDLDKANTFIEWALNSIGLSEEFTEENVKLIVRRTLGTKNEMIEGIDRLIKHLYENNIPMAIATNGSFNTFKILTKPFDTYFSKYFSHIVCGADDPEVKYNKPKPDIYLVCVNRFEIKPKTLQNCVIFEDSLIGITGAIDSGMKTVLINDRSLRSFDEIANKMTIIVDTIKEFKPESVGLPHYKSNE